MLFTDLNIRKRRIAIATFDFANNFEETGVIGSITGKIAIFPNEKMPRKLPVQTLFTMLHVLNSLVEPLA